MGYAEEERLRNTGAGALSTALTGAGIGTAIAPGIGTAIGGGIGALIGGVAGYFLTDDEQNEMIEAYREGRLDDETVANIERTISRRYNLLGREQQAALARSGLSRSSLASRQIADTANAERRTLAEVLTGEVERRQAIGFGMSADAGAQRAQDVVSGIGALFQGYQVYQEGEAMKADAARSESLAAAIGKLFEDGPPGPTPTPAKAPKVAFSQHGAGNAFARHRSRHPNVKSPFVPNTKDVNRNDALDAIFKRKLPSWAQ